MHPQRRLLAWLNVLGGIAVLGSYAHGLATHPATRMQLWGDVPDGIRPLYTASMFGAMFGYFAFTYFVFLRADPERTRTALGLGYALFPILYGAMLLSAALWMPLTFAWLAAPSAGLWLAVRGVLAVTGLASVGIVVALLRMEPRTPAWAHRLAVLGSVLFAWQTAVLDALVWTAYFPA